MIGTTTQEAHCASHGMLSVFAEFAKGLGAASGEEREWHT